jgi:hypothetical protein
VTEVGHVQKTFLDCGGTLHDTTTCQIQCWVGEDEDHRLIAGKVAGILAKARQFLTDDSVPVEIEYEDSVISQYPISGFEITDDAVILELAPKHTDCLAKELCGIPAAGTFKVGAASASKSSCCGPNCC